jgi:hypothetical protein
MTNPKASYKNRDIIEDTEVDIILSEADKIQNPYFKLRAKAIVATARVFGKRESEIARLELGKIERKETTLELNFTLSKKRKKGLFQFLEYLEKHDAEKLKLTLPEIRQLWREWQQTEKGVRCKDTHSLKAVDLNDKYGKHIVAYYDFMKAKHPGSFYLFPLGKNIFGKTYAVYYDKHLAPKYLLEILKSLKYDCWMHLFRETKGAQVARENGRTLESIHAVKETLDLEDEATAQRYVRRYCARKEHS